MTRLKVEEDGLFFEPHLGRFEYYCFYASLFYTYLQGLKLPIMILLLAKLMKV